LAGCAAEPDETDWQAYLAELKDVEAHGMTPANPGTPVHPTLPYWLEGPIFFFDVLYGSGGGPFPNRQVWRAQRTLSREVETRGGVEKKVFDTDPAPDAAIDVLIAATRHADWAVRGAATLVVGELPHLGRRPEERPRVSLALVMRAKDEAAIVRAAAAHALGMLIEGPDDGRGDALESLLGDADPYVRHHAACALARIGQATPAVLPILRDSLKHENGWVVAGAIVALTQIGFPGKAAASDLPPLLRHPHSTVRSNAYSALERLDPEALENNPDADKVRQEREAYRPQLTLPPAGDK
jgi:hypothetical protein